MDEEAVKRVRNNTIRSLILLLRIRKISGRCSTASQQGSVSVTVTAKMRTNALLINAKKADA